MKILFAVLSGTGNTLKIAEGLMAKLHEQGHETEFFRVRRGEILGENTFDLLAVCYPVHAFNTPKTMLQFLKKLPYGGGKLAVLVRTSGEPLKCNEASGITPRRILKKHGYAVRGEFGYVMPYNIIFRHSEEMASRMWQAAEHRFAEDAAAIARADGSAKKINLYRRAVSFVLRIERPAMPVIGRTFHAKKKKCIGCGKCAKVCPTGNITMKDGRPKFGGHCIGCMACAFSCPEDAVRTSILNAWRVNGQYSFSAPPAADSEVCRYCRRSYLKYFHSAEQDK